MIIPPELIFKVYHTFISEHSPTGDTCKLLNTGKEVCEGCPASMPNGCGLISEDNKDHSASIKAFYEQYPELLI